jgi:hypothetical protein
VPEKIVRQSGHVLLWVDAVEKVANRPSLRNNRIGNIEFLNRSCVFTSVLESMLLVQASQNPFSTASVKSGHVHPYDRATDGTAATCMQDPIDSFNSACFNLALRLIVSRLA